jgi:hypothetical protein
LQAKADIQLSAIQNEFDDDNAVSETASNLATFVKKSESTVLNGRNKN